MSFVEELILRAHFPIESKRGEMKPNGMRNLFYLLRKTLPCFEKKKTNFTFSLPVYLFMLKINFAARKNKIIRTNKRMTGKSKGKLHH